jgi:drug/metabolite transporter (DMT)-like permease
LGTTIFGLWGYMSDSFVVSSDAYIWQIFWVSMIGYAVHIITEVWGRANMTMTQYNIVFQTQIVFLILFGVIFFSSFTVTIKLMLGALYVIISAILAVIDRYRDQDHTKTNSVLVTGIIMTVISAA